MECNVIRNSLLVRYSIIFLFARKAHTHRFIKLKIIQYNKLRTSCVSYDHLEPHTKMYASTVEFLAGFFQCYIIITNKTVMYNTRRLAYLNHLALRMLWLTFSIFLPGGTGKMSHCFLLF